MCEDADDFGARAAQHLDAGVAEAAHGGDAVLDFRAGVAVRAEVAALQEGRADFVRLEEMLDGAEQHVRVRLFVADEDVDGDVEKFAVDMHRDMALLAEQHEAGMSFLHGRRVGAQHLVAARADEAAQRVQHRAVIRHLVVFAIIEIRRQVAGQYLHRFAPSLVCKGICPCLHILYYYIEEQAHSSIGFFRKSFRFPFQHIRKQDIGEQGEHEKDRGRGLCARERPENLFCIVAAQEFERKACRAVEHDVERKRAALDMRESAVEQQNGENREVELSLPDLRGPERRVPVDVVGERRGGIQDAVTRAGRRTESVAVQQVRAAAERLTEYDGRRENVEQVDDVEVVVPAVEDADDDAEQDAALNRHAALPDVQQLGQVIMVVIPVEKEYIPEPRAEQAGEPAVDAEVDDVFFRALAVGLCEKVRDARGEDDGKR